MKKIFSEYKNNTEIIDYENQNLNQRLLRDIADYVLANKFEFSDAEVETQREKSCSNDNLLDCSDLADDTEENIINSQ